MTYFAPRGASSTKVQCELYRQLVDLGIRCDVEYSHGNCRFDLVIIRNSKIIVIVEAKKRSYRRTAGSFAVRKITRHSRKYSFGVPVVCVLGIDEVPYAIERILNIVNQHKEA